MHTPPSAVRRLGVVAIAALACTAAIPAGASAKARAAQAGGSVGSAPAVSKAAWAAGRAKYGDGVTKAQALSAYWTPARMRAATPADEASYVADAAQRYERLSAERQNAAKEKVERGEQPAPEGTEFTVRPSKAAAPGATPTTAAAAAFNPNLSYWTPTARTNGKVFFNMNGGSYKCSASIVNSEGADTVWSAGHCIHGGQGGQWATNWVFVPSYDDDLANPRPYGTWTANQLWTRTAWVNNSDFAEDMGVAIMNMQFGYHIVNYFGGNGFRANIGKNVYDYSFGYPAEAPFDGGNLFRCSGSTSPEWSFGWASSETVKMSCDMTRGCSGGPWLNGYDGNWGYLNGINSRIDRIVGPTVLFSPYFDNTALGLYNDTRYL